MEYYLEFSDADDSRLKTAFAERIESDSPIPIPAVGDTVMVAHKYLVVVHRLISYYDNMIHAQCFCRESHEGNIKKSCGQSG